MSDEKSNLPGRPRQFEDKEIIDAAVAVFSTNGYAGTSAQNLCDSTGLGRGSLYNAFGSKQAIPFTLGDCRRSFTIGTARSYGLILCFGNGR